MFSRLPDARSAAAAITLDFEGREISAKAGDTVAAALALANIGFTRTTPVSGAARAPYCMMGVCFDCIMVIDGIPDRQACMVEVEPGMKVSRQYRAAEVAR
jgi:predicted molibdopterin-dependent oxidoreductase YjgC